MIHSKPKEPTFNAVLNTVLDLHGLSINSCNSFFERLHALRINTSGLVPAIMTGIKPLDIVLESQFFIIFMQKLVAATIIYRAELQWLEHWWLIYQLVLVSNSFLSPWGKKTHSCRFGIILGDFLFYIENGILCVLIRIASMRRF